MNQWICAIALMVLFTANSVSAAPDIRVNGLFKDRALLTINGKQKLLKVGETGADGVRLLSSDSKQAKISVNGQVYTLGLSQEIASGFSKPEVKEVRIPAGVNGHYFVSGRIEGKAVEFMVDTGASSIAMSLKEAERLGINYRRGEPQTASTAGGMVNAFRIQLDKVSVGAITLRQVPATVVIGDFPQQILLGNSFLGLVNLREEQGVLVLTSKF